MGHMSALTSAPVSERELTGAFGRAATAPAYSRPAGSPPHALDPPAALGDLERQHIIEMLKQVKGNRMAAARLLGISRRALYRRLERYHITDESPRNGH